MEKIIFTKKHIFLSVGILSLLLLIFGLVFVLFTQPKHTKIKEIKLEQVQKEREIVKAKKKIVVLHKEKDLLSSEVVEGLPKIPNGIEITEFLGNLKEIRDLKDANKVKLEQMSLERSIIFPEGKTLKDVQVMKSRVVMDFKAYVPEDLTKFVEELEKQNRFVKITAVNYDNAKDDSKNDPSLDEIIAEATGKETTEELMDYSCTVSMDIYYLSAFDTELPVLSKK
ncbi:MAG: hypothetical protein LBM95_08420 [Lactobacillales bacterium]|nr:hypothetical protein [Lactobacillales bacterium]